jgi:hypothetical protein
VAVAFEHHGLIISHLHGAVGRHRVAGDATEHDLAHSINQLLEVLATDILEAEWTLVTVVADASVERGTLTTEAPQGRGCPAVTAGMVTMIFRS